MADFLCIFCRNLKLMATPQFCEQNSEIFFGGLRSISPALGKIRNSYLDIFEFQDTLIWSQWLKSINNEIMWPLTLLQVCKAAARANSAFCPFILNKIEQSLLAVGSCCIIIHIIALKRFRSLSYSTLQHYCYTTGAELGQAQIYC